MRQNVKLVKDLGRHLYEDSRGRIIYIDPRTDRTYVIEKEQQGLFSALKSWSIIGLCVAIIVGYAWEWLYGIIIGVVCAAAVYFFFHKVYLGKLQEIDAKIESVADDTDNREKDAEAGKTRLIIRVVAAIAIPFLLAANCYLQVRNNGWVIDINMGLLLVVSAALAVYDITVLIRNIKALQYIKENK